MNNEKESIAPNTVNHKPLLLVEGKKHHESNQPEQQLTKAERDSKLPSTTTLNAKDLSSPTKTHGLTAWIKTKQQNKPKHPRLKYLLCLKSTPYWKDAQKIVGQKVEIDLANGL